MKSMTDRIARKIFIVNTMKRPQVSLGKTNTMSVDPSSLEGAGAGGSGVRLEPESRLQFCTVYM